MLLVGFYQFGEGEVDIFHCVSGHAFELPRYNELPVFVADSHCHNHHFLLFCLNMVYNAY